MGRKVSLLGVSLNSPENIDSSHYWLCEKVKDYKMPTKNVFTHSLVSSKIAAHYQIQRWLDLPSLHSLWSVSMAQISILSGDK